MKDMNGVVGLEPLSAGGKSVFVVAFRLAKC